MTSKTTTIIGIIILIVAIVIIGLVVSRKRAARVDNINDAGSQTVPAGSGIDAGPAGTGVQGEGFYELGTGELETLK